MSENKNTPIRICYFGIYRPSAPRDKVYLDGLKKLGSEILECVDSSPGFLKFFRLAQKYRAFQGRYDILWVGYLSTMVVPLAWIMSRIGLTRSDAVRGEKRIPGASQDLEHFVSKCERCTAPVGRELGLPDQAVVTYCAGANERSNKEMRRPSKPYRKIVFNALDSWYDRAILDRGMYSRFSPIAWLIWFFDFLALHLSDIVLVESVSQKKFLAKNFFVRPEKLKVVFTGVEEEVFHLDATVAKAENFTAVFRGMFLPATGAEFVLEAARILKDEAIKFIIIGWGEPLQTHIQKMIADWGLTNVVLITWFLPPDELRKTMLSAHAMLGQFSGHERLNRTIQNKNMEALALGLPLVTRDSASNREILANGVNSVFVPPEKPEAIADAIMNLKKDEGFREHIANGARATYRQKVSPDILAKCLDHILAEFS